MKRIIVLSVSCVFVLLMAFDCLKFPEEEIRLEFDSPASRNRIAPPAQPVGTSEQTPTAHDNVISIDGMDVDIYGSGTGLTAKDADGNAIPVLKEGDIVSASNVPNNSPTGKKNGDFLIVVVKKDGSGYAVGLIKSTLDAADNDANLGSWVDADGKTHVVAGLTTGRNKGSTVPDGAIYLGGDKKHVVIGTRTYMIDETKGQIDTAPRHKVLTIDGVDVDIYDGGSTLIAKDTDGNAIPVLKEGDMVSSSNVPSGSPTGKTSGGFLAVVLKQDGSGYAVGLIEYARDVANNDGALGSWVDESNASVVVGMTLGKNRGGALDDGYIYLGDANRKVTIAGKDYTVNKTSGWIDTTINTAFLPFIGRWFTDVLHRGFIEFRPSGDYKQCIFLIWEPKCVMNDTPDGTWDWNGNDIQLHGVATWYDDGNTNIPNNVSDPTFRDVSIDSATHQFTGNAFSNPKKPLRWDPVP